MAQLNPKEMQQALAKPFAPEDLEWRLQNTIEEKMRGLAVPYVTNRAIQNRLDEVCGPENWYNDFKPWHSNGKKEAQLCGIAIYFEGRGFITKWDGAEDSDIREWTTTFSVRRQPCNKGRATIWKKRSST